MTPWAQERFKLTKPSFGPRMVEDSNDPVNPTTINAAGCFPPGIPRIYLHPFPMEIVHTTGRVLMLFEFDHFIRQINEPDGERMGLPTIFFPMNRLERISLDEPSGSIPSMNELFARKVGRSLSDYLAQFA